MLQGPDIINGVALGSKFIFIILPLFIILGDFGMIYCMIIPIIVCGDLHDLIIVCGDFATLHHPPNFLRPSVTDSPVGTTDAKRG